MKKITNSTYLSQASIIFLFKKLNKSMDFQIIKIFFQKMV